MSNTRKIHLAGYVMAGPVSGHHGGWRYPGADLNILSPEYYQRIGRTLEAAKFDLLFVPDILAVPDRLAGSRDSQLRYGALGALRLDPMIMLATVATATRYLGLASTISTSYFEPFHVARVMATLDHLSNGRAAWNIVTSFQDAEARNFGKTEHLSRDERYDRAEEFVEVACRLWDSWKDDALVQDRETPLYADPDRVQPINHHGKWFNVEGPLNVSRPPQGRPVFIQAGASNRGKDFAAKWADVIFVTHGSIEQAKTFYADIKGRAEKFGRDPNVLKVLSGFVPAVGETKTIAQERRELIDSLCDPRAGLSTMSYQIGIDLEPYPKDELLPESDTNGVEGHYKEVSEITRKQGLTLSEMGKRYGVGPLRDFFGTGKDVADQMQQWFEAGACDGFMVQMPYAHGGIEDFARLVIPELQRRELFRTEYQGSTLRDHLGLDRPANL